MAGPIDKNGNVHGDSGQFVSLRDYVERIVRDYEQNHAGMHLELQRAIDQSDTTLQESTRTALAAIDRRLDQMNEFRASLEDVTRDAVSRDLFDIVVGRVTVVENTYLKRFDYTKDTDSLRERSLEDLAQRDRRLNELEKNTVRTDALALQAEEVARTRKTLILTIIGGVVLTVFNLIVNVLQSKP